MSYTGLHMVVIFGSIRLLNLVQTGRRECPSDRGAIHAIISVGVRPRHSRMTKAGKFILR